MEGGEVGKKVNYEGRRPLRLLRGWDPEPWEPGSPWDMKDISPVEQKGRRRGGNSEASLA